MKINQKAIKKQYNNPSNLDSRRSLNERFGTNKYGWYKWMFDHFNFSQNPRILELGCGLGSLWAENQARVHGTWDITLSDFSKPMLDKTRQNLKEADHLFNFQQIDSQKIPYPDDTFDVVIANHMLYLVPDIKRALEEMARVIKPGGVLVTSTSGSNYMKELQDLLEKSNLPVHRKYTNYSFSLENGQNWLSPYFSKVKLFRYKDGLLVTEAKPLTDYILSTNENLSEVQKEEVRDFFDKYFSRHHQLRITKEAGLFIARKS